MIAAIRNVVFAIGFAWLLIRAVTTRSPLRLMLSIGVGLLRLALETVRDVVLAFFKVARGEATTRTEPGERVVPEGPDSWLPHMPLIVWWQDLVNYILAQLQAPGPVPVRPRITAPPPARFPEGIPVYEALAENFEGSHHTASVWHAVPWDVEDVLRIVNWAAEHRYPLRVVGRSHSWSPLTVGACGDSDDIDREIIAIDLHRLDHRAMVGEALASFGAGVSLESALRFLDNCEPRRALARSAAIGEITIGGLLAIGGHGTGAGEGGAFTGSTISALVDSVEVVSWNAENARYETRTITRDDPELAVLAAGLGGALITEATLRTVAPYDLEAVQRPFKLLDYLRGRADPRAPVGDPEASQQRHPTLRHELERGPQRLELLWMPYQGEVRGMDKLRMVRRGWHKCDATEAAREQPPYWDFLLNWASADLDLAFRRALAEARDLHPDSLGRRFQTALWASTLATHRRYSALSGSLYSTAMVVRYHAAGWCLVCERARIGELLEAVAKVAQDAQVEYGRPFTGPIEVRVTDCDTSSAVALSPARAPADRPDVEALCAVWFSVMTDLRDPRRPVHEEVQVPPKRPTVLDYAASVAREELARQAGRDAPHDRGPTTAGHALRAIEQWLLAALGDYGLRAVRPEWSKGFAYDAQGRPWSDASVLARYRAGFEAYETMSADDVAVTLRHHDPQGLFRTPLIECMHLDAPRGPTRPRPIASRPRPRPGGLA